MLNITDPEILKIIQKEQVRQEEGRQRLAGRNGREPTSGFGGRRRHGQRG